MNLTPMRYKDYVWPHNPKTYRIQYQRRVAVHKIPFGRYAMQDMGLGNRVMTGEGEFFGKDAYGEFKKLASVFYQDGAGTLYHPVWQTSTAYFTQLSLAQEPREDYVRYTFTFWEEWREKQETVSGGGQGNPAEKSGTAQTPSAGLAEQYHTVVQGETLWGLSRQYGLTLGGLLDLNPQIKNPNVLPVGTRVRVR